MVATNDLFRLFGEALSLLADAVEKIDQVVEEQAGVIKSLGERVSLLEAMGA